MIQAMGIYIFILLGGIALLTGSALLALHWAMRTGEFTSPAKTALQIFDEEEPVGKMTDGFPGMGVTKKDSARSELYSGIRKV